MRHVSAIVAIVCAMLCVGSEALPTTYFVNRPGVCWASSKAAKQQMPLEFCHWYNERSCCNPGHDQAASGAFFGMLAAGPGCAPMNQKVRATYREARELLCMPCDPLEPRFRVRRNIGDAHLGGSIAADPTAAENAFTWRICLSFVFGKPNDVGGLWGLDGSKYDDCGMQVQNDCNSRTQVTVNPATGALVDTGVSVAPDGISCGATFVVPSTEFANETETGTDAQMSSMQRFVSKMPHWMQTPDFTFVDDLAARFVWNNTPCFGRRAPDGFVETAGVTSISSLTALILAVAALIVAA